MLRILAGIALLLLAGTGVWAVAQIRDLDRQLVEKFAGRRWDLPSRIYTDARVVHAGSGVPVAELVERLTQLEYRPVEGAVEHPGEYRREPGVLEVHLRGFRHTDHVSSPIGVRIVLPDERVGAMERLDDGSAVDSIELEPEQLAGIYERVWEERRVVRLRELPALLVRAVLAAEDRRFFEHPGIDVRGVARALVANLRSGRVVQGGSTLTQQLIKNFFLTEARTFRRKITEAVMALLAERRFTKLEILETYLNEIYLGQRGPKGIYGVWEGSRFYFGKEPKDLSVSEAATLAGLIKAPGLFSPTRDPERARRRRNEVLSALFEQGEIGSREFATALLEPLPDRLPTVEGTEAAHFVDFVRAELEGRYPAEALTSQGFRIFTSLDPVLQRAAERALREGLEDLERRHPRLVRPDGDPVEACLLALEPRTGEIKAMVGGRSYGRSQFNRVTQARRQPGSVFKPIVFLAAMEEEERRGSREYVATRTLVDEPFTWRYDGREWSPRNYRDLYHGEVTLRRALELSLNSVTARLAQEIGIERVRDLAIRLGFRDDLPALPSLVLGGVEVTPFEVAQAFAALANLGFRPEAASIRTVLDSEGEALTRNPMVAEQVVSPRVAYLVTSFLEGVVDRGTARSIRDAGLGAPVAGKTGTTNDGRDAWFVGYTPDLLAVVWVGFDRGDPLGLSGAEAALPLWIEFMKTAIPRREPAAFLVPPGIERARIDPGTGKLATPECPVTLDEAFFAGDAPIEACPVHGGTRPVETPTPPLLYPTVAPGTTSPEPAERPASGSWWSW